jgi:hypothetical protein
VGEIMSNLEELMSKPVDAPKKPVDEKTGIPKGLTTWAEEMKREGLKTDLWPYPRMFKFRAGTIGMSKQKYDSREVLRYEFPVDRITEEAMEFRDILFVTAKHLIEQIVDWTHRMKKAGTDPYDYACLIVREGEGRSTKYTFRGYELKGDCIAAYNRVRKAMEALKIWQT